MFTKIISAATACLIIVIVSCNNKATTAENQSPQSDVNAVVTTEKAAYINLNPLEFKKALADDEISFLIDVRTPEETEQGMIEGAIEIDFQADDFKTKTLLLDKNKSYYIYCRSGGRSSNAAEFMIDNGFTKVYNLEGGYDGWKEANK